MSTVREIFNLSCPSCGSDRKIHIHASCWVCLKPEGRVEHHYADWDCTNHAECQCCGHYGRVGDFAFDKTLGVLAEIGGAS